MKVAWQGAWTALALGGALSWGTATGFLNPVAAPALDDLPAQLGLLSTLAVFEVDPGLLGEWPPDGFTYRRVADPAGREGLLYAAWFERGRRWSGRPHELEICYQVAGWEPETRRRLWTAAGASFTAQDFHSDQGRIRVFHWTQQPGLAPGSESVGGYLRRMMGPSRLRQDMASIYLEFPLEQAPEDAVAAEAAGLLMDWLETAWSGR